MADAKPVYDLIVIGSGPGGYVAAIRASQLGMKVAIVERSELGGICLNWGCIPTKALLRSSEVFHLIAHAKDFGITVENPKAMVDAIVKRSRGVAKQLSQGVTFLMKKHKIDVLEGSARIEKGQSGSSGAPKVIVEKGKGEGTYTPKRVLLATGARAREMPDIGLKADGKTVWTYREAMVPEELPKRLLVIGSGAIGIEFASFYRTLGSEVTVVEALDRILPVEDAEISAAALKQFTKQGMKIITSAQVKSLKVAKGGVTAEVASKDKTETIEADKAILAIGIVGNVENLGLEALGVKVEKTHIVVDGFGKTNVPGLFAIGDVCGPPWLAHKAMHEGVIVVEGMAGGAAQTHKFDPWNVPGCTYSHPQVASVGMTEDAAKKTGRKLKVGKFPFIGNGKAIALGDSEGMVKTIFDADTGELLGAHMIGEGVTELIQGYCIARQGELTEAELMETIFPHPTLSETMHEAVLSAYGKPLHI